MAIYISNLVVYTDVDFEQTFELTNVDNSPLNLVGYTASSKIKKNSDSDSSVSFTVSFPNQETGEVKVALAATQTSQIKPGVYQYDLVLIKSGIKTRAVEGEVFVKKAVTR
jgi:hypothetical protein